MKPVLVLQHQIDDGPAYLGSWLAGQGVAMDLRCTEGGVEFPLDMAAHSGLAVLGGAMSANDPLPSMRQAERLILDAMARGVPVIGHCLGGQLMARALGASVAASPRPEVGWHAVTWQPAARAWFGPALAAADPPEVFQWHFDAFDLPDGAVPLAGNTACPHQAFSIGPHLAMQFHVELDAEKLAVWTGALDAAYHAAHAADTTQVHSPRSLQLDSATRLPAQQRLADAAYRRWLGASPH